MNDSEDLNQHTHSTSKSVIHKTIFLRKGKQEIMHAAVHGATCVQCEKKYENLNDLFISLNEKGELEWICRKCLESK